MAVVPFAPVCEWAARSAGQTVENAKPRAARSAVTALVARIEEMERALRSGRRGGGNEFPPRRPFSGEPRGGQKGDRGRVFMLGVAFVVMPGCHGAECGATRGDELEHHGSQALRAAEEGQWDQALRGVGVALGLTAHAPSLATTYDDAYALGWGSGGPRFHLEGWGREPQGRGRGTMGPTVRISPPTVSGPLSPEEIRRVVLRNLVQANRCHEQGVANSATAEGGVTIHFAIRDTGEVVASRVLASTYPFASVADCIANTVSRWRFPASVGGGTTTVDFPFNLRAPLQ